MVFDFLDFQLLCDAIAVVLKARADRDVASGDRSL
jgi:hypothetical protein